MGSEDTDEKNSFNEDFIDDEDDEVTEEKLLEYYNVLGVQPDATLEVFFSFNIFNFFNLLVNRRSRRSTVNW